MTVSVSAPLIHAAERVGARMGARSRSAVVEEALRLLVRRARDAEIEASLDAYYGAITQAQRAEERAMVRAFNRSQRRTDLDREGR